MVSVAEMLLFEAAGKYIRVLTSEAKYLIRTPLKALLLQLDAQIFWQVHQGAAVRAGAIESVLRDDNNRLALTPYGGNSKIAVNRQFSHRFKAM